MNRTTAFFLKIKPFLSPYKGIIALVFLLSIVIAGLNLLPLQIMATFIDILSGSKTKPTSLFWIRLIGYNPRHYILTFALVYILSSFIKQFYNYLVSIVGLKICEDLRTKAFTWILKTPKTTSLLREGDIVSRVIADTDMVSDAVVIPLRGLVVSVLELIWALVLLYTWSPLLSFVAFLIVPFLYLLGRWSYSKTRSLSLRKQSSIGSLTDVVSDYLRTRGYAKVYNQEQNRTSYFQQFNQNATRSSLSLTKFYMRYWPFVRIITTLGVTLTLGVAHQLFLLGKMSPEDIMVAYLYCLRVYDPILDFTRYNMMISSADAALGRVLELRV